MREIKFRAWDKVKETMYPDVEWRRLPDAFMDGYRIQLWSDGRMADKATHRLIDIEIMQYTGLKDKNGKEIYEGDILIFPEAEQWVDVIFYDGAFSVLFEREDERTILTEKLLDANYGVKVTGNVHQNPELL